jgi:uncharacterized protein
MELSSGQARPAVNEGYATGGVRTGTAKPLRERHTWRNAVWNTRPCYTAPKRSDAVCRRMTKLLLAVVLGLLSSLLALGAEAPTLTFSAILKVGPERVFGLGVPGGRSGWVKIGENFEGFTVKSFDEAAETLTLEKGGESSRLSLASARVETLNTKPTLAEATEVVEKMKFEQMLGRLIENQKRALMDLTKQMAAEQGTQVSTPEYGAFQAKLMDALWAEMKPEELQKEFTKIYADLFTRDELKAMSSFYSTPAGQAMVDKEPEMQQRLMNVLMPRMMRARPKIEQLSRDFAAQQAAKAK